MTSRLPGAILRTVMVLATGGLTLWLSTIALIIIAGEWTVLRRADAIVVLGAAQYNGRPSPVLQARLDHALALYDRGFAPRIVFTGGVGVGDTLSEGEVSRRYALRHGVPESAILVERRGTTSAASVRAAAALLRAEGMRSALIVSDSYHMMRLDLLMRRAGITPYRAAAVDAPIDLATRRTRWYYILRESVLFPATAVLGGS